MRAWHSHRLEIPRVYMDVNIDTYFKHKIAADYILLLEISLKSVLICQASSVIVTQRQHGTLKPSKTLVDPTKLLSHQPNSSHAYP